MPATRPVNVSVVVEDYEWVKENNLSFSGLLRQAITEERKRRDFYLDKLIQERANNG